MLKQRNSWKEMGTLCYVTIKTKFKKMQQNSQIQEAKTSMKDIVWKMHI